MWKALRSLFQMIEQYNACPYIGEILIIKNAASVSTLQVFEPYRKVRILNDGNNLFVNPSWNLGVSQAKYERIILANDDIILNVDFNVFMQIIDFGLGTESIVGFSENCFYQKRTETLGNVHIHKAINGRGYGFGTFMVLMKESYRIIPKELKVWYGDDILYRANIPYLIEGVEVITEMRKTSRTMNLREQHMIESKFYSRYKILK